MRLLQMLAPAMMRLCLWRAQVWSQRHDFWGGILTERSEGSLRKKPKADLRRKASTLPAPAKAFAVKAAPLPNHRKEK